MHKLTLLLFSFVLISCSNNSKIKQSFYEQEFSKVFKHYVIKKDSLKLKAAHFLFNNCSDLYYYEDKMLSAYDSIILTSSKICFENYKQKLDSLLINLKFNTKYDKDYITSEYIIKNIDLAFKAWEMPWARNLTFEEFCEYLLPYKIGNDKIENWRDILGKDYKWILDSIKTTKRQVACSYVNNLLREKFKISETFQYPVTEIPLSILHKVKVAPSCVQAAKYANYVMIYLGIPVTIDFTPHWGNRNSFHYWNALLADSSKTINFMGTENNPGMHKIQFVGTNRMNFKPAKVFRYTFSKQQNSLAMSAASTEEIPEFFKNSHFKDVTKDYVLVSDIDIEIKSNIPSRCSHSFICVFDNHDWNEIYYGPIINKKVSFKEMGRGIAYLPCFFVSGEIKPIGNPLILKENNDIIQLNPNMTKSRSIKIIAKYPEGQDNLITKGDTYELFYFDHRWVSLGKTKANTNYLIYNNAPENALFWIRNLNRGQQVRIFTYEKNTQVWW